MAEYKPTKSVDIMPNDDDWTMIMMMTMMMAVMALMLPRMLNFTSTQAITSSSTAANPQSYQGINDPRVINVTANMVYLDLINEKPYQPWMIAFIINDGPNPVNVAINYPGDTFRIDPGGTRTINRQGAAERIGVLFFQCDATQRATLRITGEY